MYRYLYQFRLKLICCVNSNPVDFIFVNICDLVKDFNFKKSEKTYSKGHFAQEFSDCLSCHLLHDGHSLLPEDFQLAFIQTDDFQKEIFAYAQRFSKLEIRYFELRGPPSHFI